MPLTAPAPHTRVPVARPLGAGTAVLAAHLGVLWLLTRALAPTPPEIIVRAEMLAQVQDPAPRPIPAAPAAAPTPTPTPPKPAPQPASPPPKLAPAPSPAPGPAPAAAPTPAAAAVATSQASTTTPATSTSPNAPAAAPSPSPPSAAAASAPTDTEKSAPPKTYPTLARPINTLNKFPRASMQLGESGQNVVRITVGTDGQPTKAEIIKSSGSPRLDKAAIQLALEQRFRPGTENGAPTTMNVDLPLQWKLPD